jgi:hypothetical protein
MDIAELKTWVIFRARLNDKTNSTGSASFLTFFPEAGKAKKQ